MDESQVKASWQGTVVSIQPRSTVWRYRLDNRTHRECGFNLFVKGGIDWGGESPACAARDAKGYDFCVAISEKQQAKLAFRIGDVVKGTGWTPLYPKCEFADLYRAGGLKVVERAAGEAAVPAVVSDVEPCYDGTPVPRVFSSDYPGPPWTILPPSLEVYSWRGARMLSKACWKGKCLACVWANMANVTVECNFDRGTVKNRFETFCYGPLSCKNYKMGPARAVPYYKDGSSMDVGWLDEIMVQWRSDEDE